MPTSFYVLGFMFSTDYCDVVLIRKNKPAFQQNLLNGIGGKLEPNETYLDAIVREYREETGVETTEDDWEYFGILGGDGWTVYLFRGAASRHVYSAKTVTDEEVYIWNVRDVLDSPLLLVPNLRWLLPLALDSNVDCVDINEKE